MSLPLFALLISAVTATVGEQPSGPPFLEQSIRLTGLAGNPFDTRDIRVDAQLRLPNGGTVELPCFLHSDGDWRFRFAPSEAGEHRYEVRVSEKGGKARRVKEGVFTARSATRGRFIGIHPHNQRYFATRDGQTFYPVGENLGWVSGAGETYEVYLRKIGNAGANWIRLWMCSWGLTALEWMASAGPMYRGLEGYSLENAARTDRIFEEALAQGIAIQLVINHHGQYSTEVNPNWDSNPENVKNGGFLKDPKEFFTHPEAKQRYRDRVRYLAARWGAYPNLFAWELWNEVNNTDALRKGSVEEKRAVLAWHREMAAYLRELDPHDHLITTSGCVADESFEDATWGLAEFDFNQAHDYVDNLPDRIRSQSERMLAHGKPFFFGELGIADHQAPEWESGTPLHDMLWASLVSPVAGTAMTWWWDLHVEKHNLYPHFTPVRKVVDSVDWATQDFRISKIEWRSRDPRRADLHLFPGVGWERSRVERISVSSLEGAPGMGLLSRYLQGTGKPEMRVEPVFDLIFEAPTRATLSFSGVSNGGADLQALLDGDLLARKEFPRSEKPDEEDAAPLEDLSFEIPDGGHALVLSNRGEDWVELKSFRLEGFADPLLALGMAGESEALVWTRVRAEGLVGDPDLPDGAEVRVPELRLGRYRIVRWDTLTGETWELDPARAEDSGLAFQTGPIRGDAFFQITRMGD